MPLRHTFGHGSKTAQLSAEAAFSNNLPAQITDLWVSGCFHDKGCYWKMAVTILVYGLMTADCACKYCTANSTRAML